MSYLKIENYSQFQDSKLLLCKIVPPILTQTSLEVLSVNKYVQIINK